MNKKKRYIEYDLIRAAAMILIVLYHMNGECMSRNITSPLLFVNITRNGQLGWQGVSLFILISGASQCISFARCEDLKTYYKKRWWGIFPSFYLAYFICFLLGGGLSGSRPLDWSFFWTVIGMDGYLSIFGVKTQYLVGEWFLGMILILYLLFPFLYKLIKKAPKTVFVVSALYYIAVLWLYPNADRISSDVILNVFVFMMGIYLYLYAGEIPMAVGVASFALWLFFAYVPLPDSLIRYLFCVQGITLYVALTALGRWLGQSDRMGALKWMIEKISKYSYEIFLLHHVLIGLSLSNSSGQDRGWIGYLRWVVEIGIVIFACAWMVHQSVRALKNKSY